MPTLKYNGKEIYFDPSGRFFLEPGDLVELVDLEAAQLISNGDFKNATKKEIEAAAAQAQTAAAAVDEVQQTVREE